MSIAIQAPTSLPTTADNLSVSSPGVLPAAFTCLLQKQAVLEKLVTSDAVVVNEFQQGTRNARIEILASGEHCVLCYDASTDYNELLIRQSKQAAIDAAQAWVKRAF